MSQISKWVDISHVRKPEQGGGPGLRNGIAIVHSPELLLAFP